MPHPSGWFSAVTPAISTSPVNSPLPVPMLTVELERAADEGALAPEVGETGGDAVPQATDANAAAEAPRNARREIRRDLLT